MKRNRFSSEKKMLYIEKNQPNSRALVEKSVFLSNEKNEIRKKHSIFTTSIMCDETITNLGHLRKKQTTIPSFIVDPHRVLHCPYYIIV